MGPCGIGSCRTPPNFGTLDEHTKEHRMGLLDGRVVIVTGAGRGLGREHCLELARQGASVVVNDLGVGLHGQDDPGPSPAEEVVDEILASGGVAMADGASVTDFTAIAAMVQRTVETYGRLDAVVNNAGIVRDRMITGMSEEDFDLVVAVHLKGSWNLTRHACAYWRDRHKAGETVSGRIVNTTSGSGLFGNVGQSNYGAAKAGIASLTIITAMEMERYGVTANAVSPLARTRMTEGLGGMPRPVEGFDPYDPGNTSPVVAYLCSRQSGWLSGSVLRVMGDTVQVLNGWGIDPARTFRCENERKLETERLDRGLRMAVGAFPSGLPAGSVAS
jgi:NAD(P)-dependent dehydrogenase (short-subunit alcohol dehydrogenase family)